jgi:hypothetical protein
MTVAGKCPHCKDVVTRLRYEKILVDSNGRKDIPAYALCCSNASCEAILSVAFQPRVLEVGRKSQEQPG